MCGAEQKSKFLQFSGKGTHYMDSPQTTWPSQGLAARETPYLKQIVVKNKLLVEKGEMGQDP